MPTETMPAEVTPLHEPFADAAQQRHAVTFGMWIFLATEVLFFGGLLVVYAAYRIWYPHDFAIGSRHLDFVLGTTNTAILLTSSLFMATAVTGLQLLDRRAALAFLVLTFLCGVAFLGVKGYEWHSAIDEGFWPAATANSGGGSDGVRLFFSLYFALTGLHAVHMLIGLGLVVTTCWKLRAPLEIGPMQNWLMLVGLYWHFVDIVWIFLYPLLYLIGRSTS